MGKNEINYGLIKHTVKPRYTGPESNGFPPKQMLNFGPFKSFHFNSYIGNNNPVKTDKMC